MGLQEADLILAVDGVPIHQMPLADLVYDNWFGGLFLGKAGERVVLRVKRVDGKEANVPAVRGTVEQSTFKIEADTRPPRPTNSTSVPNGSNADVS